MVGFRSVFSEIYSDDKNNGKMLHGHAPLPSPSGGRMLESVPLDEMREW